VSIVEIGKFQAFDERLVAVDKAVANCGVHEQSCTRQVLAGELRPLALNARKRLVEDLFGPSSAHQAAV